MGLAQHDHGCLMPKQLHLPSALGLAVGAAPAEAIARSAPGASALSYAVGEATKPQGPESGVFYECRSPTGFGFELRRGAAHKAPGASTLRIFQFRGPEGQNCRGLHSLELPRARVNDSCTVVRHPVAGFEVPRARIVDSYTVWSLRGPELTTVTQFSRVWQPQGMDPTAGDLTVALWV